MFLGISSYKNSITRLEFSINSILSKKISKIGALDILFLFSSPFSNFIC
jgi:CRISPR/Cas system endoribonuclease Cas6 (RAMP superfamily)